MQLSDDRRHESAREPNDLARFFVERGNAGDLEAVVTLVEADAVVALPGGRSTRGHVEIRRKYAAVFASKPQFSLGDQQPAMINGDIALTSTYFASRLRDLCYRGPKLLTVGGCQRRQELGEFRDEFCRSKICF